MARWVNLDDCVEISAGEMNFYPVELLEDVYEDVAPVVHAHWKEFEDYSGAVYPECSRCGLVWWLDEGTAEDNEMYYCPKCGAKMDEVIE